MKRILLFALILTIFNLGCIREGCTDVNATNYDSSADSDDGSCEFPIIPADEWAGNYMVTQESQNISAPFLPVVETDYSIVITEVNGTTVTIQNLIDCSSLEASVSETSMVPIGLEACYINSILITKTTNGFDFEINHGEVDTYEVEGSATRF